MCSYLNAYYPHFKVHTRSSAVSALSYLEGLFLAERGKRNIERMSEQNRQHYQSQHHFISESGWSAFGLMRQISQDTNRLLGQWQHQCLSIDESSNAKAGKHSVGVSRQHNGNLGKVDNCQTGVYASLCSDNTVGIVNTRLFLPKEWIDNADRCKKADVPRVARIFKTKIELALDMIREALDANVRFGWVNADGLYGQSYDFCKTIEELGCDFVVDIHRNQLVYLEEPQPALPLGKFGGRPTSKLKCHQKPLQADTYYESLQTTDFKTVKIRKGTKGWIMGAIHKVQVWVWNGKEQRGRRRTLIIRKALSADADPKYCLSNIEVNVKSHQEFAFMQAQRHWIERAFEDGKGELGMADFQVRKYTAWYHHQALVMLAMQYVNKEKTELKQDIPLLSIRDVRLQIIATLKLQNVTLETEIEQMLIRHKQRQRDIDRYYIQSDSYD